MLPELVRIGRLPIHTYGLLVALGILAGVTLAEFRHRRSGGRPGAMVDLSFIVVLAGLAGGRLMFVLVNFPYFLQRPLEIPMVWQGGLVFYGGLIGGAVAFILASRKLGLPLWSAGDAAAPGIALGHAFGRLGCFAAGCCYGAPTSLPWGVVFTDPRCLVAEDLLGTRLHPAQLYEALGLLLLAALLMVFRPRKPFPGQVIALYGLLYGLLRFGLEFLRTDPRGSLGLFGLTLSTSQAISLVLVPVSLAAYLALKRAKASS